MAGVDNSVETVNAAAAAIVTAESRAQPVSVQKRRWASCWSLYWCFGSPKTSKRISHAALVPEPTVTDSTVGVSGDPNPATSTTIPFMAPPSSPFLQSDPPTAIHSPGGFLTLTSPSITADCSAGQVHIFTLGPYAHETQLVSPPVFSALTTEPSTAAVTPQLTTPSSPEVPFAQLLTSSLNRARRNSGGYPKRSYYEVHHLISPGSANSASGTSSPYPQSYPVLEFPMVDASKLFDSKKISGHQWGPRIGSGSLTPDGVGFVSYDSLLLCQISEGASLANSETGSLVKGALVDHRVSFVLNGEDTSTFVEQTKLKDSDKEQGMRDKSKSKNDVIPLEVQSSCKLPAEEASTGTPETNSGEMKDCQHKQSSVSLGSVKEFNFDSSEMQIPANSALSTEWWNNEAVEKDMPPDSENSWTFFPLLQPAAGVN